MFEGIKARLDRLFREHARSDPRAYAAGLREALLEAKVGIGAMRDALAATRRELEAERKQLADAERRGQLAEAVLDQETVTLAARFAVRHRERVLVLERKLAVQEDELTLADREVEEMAGQYRTASAATPSDSIAAAWRELESAGATRPTEEADRVQTDADRRLREQAVEAQLAYLKRKMGKDHREG